VLAVFGRQRALRCPPEQRNELGWMFPHHSSWGFGEFWLSDAAGSDTISGLR
jgi:hypothetical protein